MSLGAYTSIPYLGWYMYIRTKSDGVYKARTSSFGTVYIPCDDPDATHDGPPEGFTLRDPFPKLDGANWARIISLFYHFLDEQREVSVVLLRDVETQTRWRVAVPKQKTDATTCECDLTSMLDLETGAPLGGIPDGWYHAGSAHSHHGMTAFPSGTDDESERGVPGLHIIAGSMDADGYRVYTSVVQMKTRYKVQDSLVLDTDGGPGARYHPSVLELVEEKERFTFTFRGFDDTPKGGVLLDGKPLASYTGHSYIENLESKLTPKEARKLKMALELYEGLPPDGQRLFRARMTWGKYGS